MTELDRRPLVTSPGGRPAPPASRPARRSVRRDVGIAAAGGIGVVAVAAAGLAITSGAGGVAAADLAVVQSISGMHSPLLDAGALLIDRLLGPQLGMALVLLFAVAVWVTTRRVVEALTVLGVALLPWAAAETMKVVVGRDRPDPRLLVDPLLIEPHSFSFPSGHTALATGLALAIVLVVRGRRAWRLVAVVAALGVVVVAASRVWIGVHYPTDTVASTVLGCSVLALVLPSWRRLVDRFDPVDRLDRFDRRTTIPPLAATAPDSERNHP